MGAAETRRAFAKARAWFPAAAWMALIFIVSSVPGEKIPAVFPSQDVLFHGLCYGILGLFCYRGLKFSGTGLPKAGLIAVSTLLCILYGISDEFHQSFIPGRTATVFDVSVDAAGSFAGSLFANFISAWLK